MKIVSIHKNDLELITLAASNNRNAQQAIYEKFSPKMLSICRRYFADIYLAEDAMIQAFLKVFLKLNTYDANGSFEGWIKRIVVNECIDQLRKSKLETVFEELEVVSETHTDIDTIYDADQIQYHIDTLPVGCFTRPGLVSLVVDRPQEGCDLILAVGEPTVESLALSVLGDRLVQGDFRGEWLAALPVCADEDSAAVAPITLAVVDGHGAVALARYRLR